MNFSNLIKHNLAIVGLLAGFTTGSISSATYYQRQKSQEIRAFMECQAAWEKYYQLNQPTNQLLVNSESISQKLNTWGLKINPSLIYAASHLIQQQWPEFRLEKESSFNLRRRTTKIFSLSSRSNS